MKKILLFLLVLFYVPSIFAQDEIFTYVETTPEFPGGLSEMYVFLGKNMKYPTKAMDNNIQGTVKLSFVVEKNGEITDVKVLNGIGSGCDKEAVRVVQLMPNWSPGFQRGKAVRVQYTLPLTFQLDESKSKKRQKKKKSAE